VHVSRPLYKCAFAQAFARAAFEEDVVRQYDCGAAVLLQDGEDVLEKIELLVTRARPDLPAR
jgi:hypothetical protein